MRTVFVTAQGGAYSQFKRALQGRNVMTAWTLAAELPKVPFADALELLLLAVTSSRRDSAERRLAGTLAGARNAPYPAGRRSLRLRR